MTDLNLTRQKHLPYASASHASIHHATKFKLCMDSNLSTPRSAVIDGIISYGGSTGIGLNLPRKAYGEFYERNHLFTKVPVDSKKKLADVKPLPWQEKLLSLCQDGRDAEACLAHEFAFTRVYNLFDNTPADYFHNAISLNGRKEDAPYLYFSDSCACASHPVREKALYNSLMEFIERQALLGSWLSQRCHYAIDPQLLKELTPYRELTERLLDNGNLCIFANGNHLPGHTVILFYFAHSPNDMVQYSIGSSSGLTLREALTSSLEELYQCYTFLYNMECSEGLANKAGAGYHLQFQQCNHAGIKETIPFFKTAIPCKVATLDDVHALKEYRYEEVLSALSALSTDIFYYHAFDDALGLHFTKIMSPDFFAHMSLNNGLNVDNPYARALNITPENAYLVKIPFP
ncbi:hypothetical protein GH742_09285 [Legionella sp. MW5194]|uniref:YcaO-like family protein n=1 Tax=Legionella sp. MW5194 TaxID=2662448 RepID=UPI00193CF62A|nr:YcaO-like family protein [Legionella sp. MW5194]QRN04050.1 hypothetical protein GH742_09285 [Legionella sp. MW5194]